jgi:hypothetical protein
MYKKVTKEYYTPPNALIMQSTLLVRLLEYIKETPSITDVEIHKLVEVASAWNQKYDTLNMDCYSSLISGTLPN